MEAFVKAFRNINYEVFGLIMPGLFALIGVGGLILLDYIALGKVSAGEVSKYSQKVEQNWVIALGALLIGTYLAGHLLTLVSKYGIVSVFCVEGIGRRLGKLMAWIRLGCLKRIFEAVRIEALWLRFLLLLGKTDPKVPHRESYADLEIELRKQLGRRLGLTAVKGMETWHDFYVLAKTFIGSVGQESLIANYQDKYTFYRSLASLFALMFWICVASAVILSIHQTQTFWFNLMMVLAIASFMFLNYFAKSFARFWSLFGDIVLAELSVTLALESKKT